MFDATTPQSPAPLPFRPTGDFEIDRYLALKAGELSVLDTREALTRLEEIGGAAPREGLSAFMWRIFCNRLGDFEDEIKRRAQPARATS